MKAVVIREYGGQDKLVWDEVPMPEIGDGDVLIEVVASSVNPVDWKIREGYLASRIHYEFPLILGWDVAGVVTEVGRHVTQFTVGDAVMSRPDIRRPGTYAEYVAVDENLVAPKPDNLSFIEAAAVPLAGLTAWEAIIEIGKVSTADRVLILGGSGGVGGFAIQLATWRKAFVAATSQANNLTYLEELGANAAFDYAQPWPQNIEPFDIVFDTAGHQAQQQAYPLLRRGGLMVSVASVPDSQWDTQFGVHSQYFFLEPDGRKLRALGDLLQSGIIRPTIRTVLPLDQIREAHGLSEAGHGRGKIVLEVKKV